MACAGKLVYACVCMCVQEYVSAYARARVCPRAHVGVRMRERA